MHVAASNPAVLSPADVSEELIAKEKEIFLQLNADKIAGKPENIVENMIKGRINKFLAEASLVEQPFVKDPEVKVGDLAKKAGAEIVSFVRYEVGEGIEKAEVDFAAEVAAQVAATRNKTASVVLAKAARSRARPLCRIGQRICFCHGIVIAWHQPRVALSKRRYFV